ncbi:hypothetical protein [Sinomonas atrocyanea]|uniref:hypothetical protein n=1 Tax=Sinomonas atrocyanea TaxID=37927 RepID=UPI003D96B291
MRTATPWRVRAVALARHAAAAAGLGLAWLVVSGSPASAASGDLLGGTVASPSSVVSSVASPAVSEAATIVNALPAVSPAGGSPGEAVSGTTTLLGAVVENAPDVLAPVAHGPLAPVAPILDPVVGGTTAAVGGVVSVVGDASGAAVDDAVLPLPDLVAPASQIAVTIQPAPSAPAPEAVPPVGAEPEAPSAPGQTAVSDPAPSVGPRAVSAPAPWSLTSGYVFTAFAAHHAADALSGILPALPSDEQPLISVLPPAPAPGSLGGSSSGLGGGPIGAAALAAASFSLALLWRVGARLRPAGPPLPTAPAFDPGSTPD